MKKEKPIVGGGWKAIVSVMRYAKQIGYVNLWRTINSKNACKACAFGTGGQNGGLKNESKRGIEICNKNIQAHVSDIREAIPNTFFLENSIASLTKLRGKQLEDLGRLATPLFKKQGDNHYTPISIEDAIDKCAAKLKNTDPNQTFFYASGRSSNEAAFTLQLLARLYGTNNINNCSFYCHQASGVGLSETIGTGTATIQYQDLEKADVIFVFGANPASNHPRFLKTLMQCRRRGGKVIVVNPAREPGMVRFASPSDWRSMLKGGEEIASTYVQPHCGGDVAFMQGIAKWLLGNRHHNATFIEKHTEGFEVFSQQIKALTWEEIVASSGVDKKTIWHVAKEYGHAKSVVFSWSMGLTHHLHGVENVQTLVSLALMRGMIGKPGAGLLPLRGHSNIQGTGSMGFTPELKKAVIQRLEDQLGESLPMQKGLDTMACMEASSAGKMQAAILLGGNLLASNPDTRFATEALNNIPFKCFISSTINMSHVNGVEGEVLILPIKVRDEELEPTTQESMFNFVRMSEGGIDRFPQLISEINILRKLGKKLIAKSRFDFSLFDSNEKIRDFVGNIIPGFNQLRLNNSQYQEFQIDGRTLHTPIFVTASNKAKFIYHQCMKARLPAKKNAKVLTFYLTSVRSEGQFNSIIYHEEDTYRGQNQRNVVLMNPKDIASCGLKHNMRVNIHSKTGSMKDVTVRAFDIREGNVMAYYPEANVLVPRAVDAKSGTPAFKSVAVTIESLGIGY